MIRVAGAVCLVVGGWALGFNVQRRKRASLRAAREVLRILEELKGEVCSRRTPLPLLMERLRARLRLEGARGMEGEFEAEWEALSYGMGLDGEARKAFCTLGLSLSRGGDEERAFSAAEEEVRRSIRLGEEELQRQGRLPGTLGLCCGALLAIFLL